MVYSNNNSGVSLLGGNEKFAFVAPHELATQAGLAVLEKGGHAVDAMISAAAMIAVAYPHMNSLGGDGFWLVHEPGKRPWAVDASGCAAKRADAGWYRNNNCEVIPSRGPLAALTMAGTVSGWCEAKSRATKHALDESWGAPDLPLGVLLGPAVERARKGISVTKSLEMASVKVAKELRDAPEYQRIFTRSGEPLVCGEQFKNPGLAHLLECLIADGLDSFYRGPTAQNIGEFLQAVGSPIALEDFESYVATDMPVLEAETRFGTAYNLSAPTQGFASLMLLGCFDSLYEPSWTESEVVHALIECTKIAFIERDKLLADPSRVPESLQTLLSKNTLKARGAEIDLSSAMPWPVAAQSGDTVWMGALDKNGVMVSFIQSIFWEFGSGVVVPEYGLVWNNRGSSFSLREKDRRFLLPMTKPFHTLNPAMMLMSNGDRISYGTMGGEGQPQTQAAMIARHLYLDRSIEQSVSAPRWLLGRTWGDDNSDLKIEADIDQAITEHLSQRGQVFNKVTPVNELMGHAGMLRGYMDARAPGAASDPRSDGLAVASGSGR